MCVWSLQSPVANRTQHLPAGVSTQHLLWWHYTNFWDAVPLVDDFPLLWTASLAEFPEAEFLVSLSQGLQFASLGCLRAPQKSVPGLLVPTEIPCLPASAPITCGSEQHPNLLCPVDFFSSRSWILALGRGPLFQVCFLCGYIPSAPGFSLSSLSSAVVNIHSSFLYSKKCDLKLIVINVS